MKWRTDVSHKRIVYVMPPISKPNFKNSVDFLCIQNQQTFGGS